MASNLKELRCIIRNASSLLEVGGKFIGSYLMANEVLGKYGVKVKEGDEGSVEW